MTAPQNNHSQDHDFHQLTGAFDRPITPSPNFADALKKHVHEEETRMQQLQTLPVRPVSHRTARATAQPLAGRRSLDIAIAAAVIIGMLASTFWYANTRIGEDGPLPPEATHYAAQPLSSESTPDAENTAIQTGDPGKTTSYPAGFDPQDEHVVIPLGNESPESVEYAAISGDTLVVSGNFPEWIRLSSPGLTAIDLKSGTVIWARELLPLNEFVISNGQIVGAFAEPPVSEYAMMSISVETGRSLWSGDMLAGASSMDAASTSAAMFAFRPTAIRDLVYYIDGEGTLISLDTATGDERWSLPLGNETEDVAWGRGGSAVGDDQAVYVVDRENVIRKLDPATGDEIARFPLADRPAGDYLVDLHLRGDVLLYIAMINAPAGTTVYADAISTSDGAPLWSQRLGMAGPGISMTDDIVAIPRHVSVGEMEAGVDDVPKQGAYVSFLDLQSGEPVSLYGPSDYGMQVTSASGDVICINEGMQITCVDMAEETPSPVVLDYAPGYESVAPLLYWNDTAIVLDVDDGVTLLRPKDTQPQQAGTPMLPGDPGHTSAWKEPFDTSGGLYAHQLGGEPRHGASALLVGDILIAEGKRLVHEDPVSFSGTGIYAQDLTTGEILWRNTDQVHQRYTADDSAVYIPSQPATDVQRLIALDLDTGEERWRSDPLSTFSSFPDAVGVLHAGSPIAIDGTVYLPMLDGNVIAFDGATGDIVWAYGGMGQNIMSGDATIAGDADRIYAVAADNVITVLDRETGALEREFVLDGVPPSDYSLWPHVQGDHLIIQARAKGDDTPGGMLVALDVASGEEYWRQETGVMRSNVVVTPDRVGIVHAAFEDPSFVERIFSDTQLDGALSFSLFDLATGAPIDVPEGVLTQVDDVWSAALASSGETICLLYTTVTCFDLDGTVVTVDGYETSHITTIGQGLLFWNGRLVILSPLTPNHLGGPGTHPKGTPVATPVAATPIATPVVATPEATP